MLAKALCRLCVCNCQILLLCGKVPFNTVQWRGLSLVARTSQPCLHASFQSQIQMWAWTSPQFKCSRRNMQRCQKTNLIMTALLKLAPLWSIRCQMDRSIQFPCSSAKNCLLLLLTVALCVGLMECRESDCCVLELTSFYLQITGNLNWKREVYCGRGIIPPLNIGYWGGWDNWTVAAVCLSLLPSRKSTATDWEHSVVWGHLYHDWCACISLMLEYDFSNCAWFHVITYEGLWRFFFCLLLHHAAWQCHDCLSLQDWILDSTRKQCCWQIPQWGLLWSRCYLFQHHALLKRLYRLWRSVLFLVCSGWFPPWIEVTLASAIWMQMFGMSLSFSNLMWGDAATRVYAREYNAEFCMDGGCNPGQSSVSSEPAYHQSRVWWGWSTYCSSQMFLRPEPWCHPLFVLSLGTVAAFAVTFFSVCCR